MAFNLGELLKDSAYKLTQFSEAKIQALEAAIITKEIRGKLTPHVTCLVRQAHTGRSRAPALCDGADARPGLSNQPNGTGIRRNLRAGEKAGGYLHLR